MHKIIIFSIFSLLCIKTLLGMQTPITNELKERVVQSTSVTLQKIKHSTSPRILAFIPEGPHILMSDDNQLIVHCIKTMANTTFSRYPSFIEALAIAPNKRIIATATNAWQRTPFTSKIFIHNIDTKNNITHNIRSSFAVHSLAFNNNAQKIAFDITGISSAYDKTGMIEIVNLVDQNTECYVHHKDIVSSIAFNDNDILASASADKTVCVTNTQHDDTPIQYYSHTDKVNAVIWFNNNTVISGSSDKTINIYDVAQHMIHSTLQPVAGTVECLTINADKSLFASGAGHHIQLWNPNHNKSLYTIAKHENISSDQASTIKNLTWNANNKFIAASYWSDNTIRIWDIRNVSKVWAQLNNPSNHHMLATELALLKTISNPSDDEVNNIRSIILGCLHGKSNTVIDYTESN